MNDIRKYLKLVESAMYQSEPVEAAPKSQVRELAPVLNSSDEIVSYIMGINPKSNETLLADYFSANEYKAVLTVIEIDDIREGQPDINVPDWEKQRRYDAMDMANMPPIVVHYGKIMDGNHRYRAAKHKGATALQVYDVMDASLNESENRVIKLGGGRNDGPARSALNDIMDQTEANMFSNGRIFGHHCVLEVSVFDGALHLSDIRAISPRSGGGTAGMNMVCAIADKHSVKITLNAQAYLDGEGGTMKNIQLINWYKRFGFDIDVDWEIESDDDLIDGIEMIRYPK